MYVSKVLVISNRKQAWLKQARKLFLVMEESIEPQISWDEEDFGDLAPQLNFYHRA